MEKRIKVNRAVNLKNDDSEKHKISCFYLLIKFM